MIDPRELVKDVENAPEAGYANINYGRLSVNVNVLTWDENKRPVRRPKKSGEVLSQNEVMELEFVIDLKELNPNLEFDYVRRVQVRKSGKTMKTDWSEIVLPSLLDTFGENWAFEILRNPYVAVEDVPNISGRSSDSGRVFGVPKFIKWFKSKEELLAYKNKNSSDKSVTEVGAVPTNIISQVRSLVQSVGEENAAKMLETRPFGNYEPELLIALAKQ